MDFVHPQYDCIIMVASHRSLASRFTHVMAGLIWLLITVVLTCFLSGLKERASYCTQQDTPVESKLVGVRHLC